MSLENEKEIVLEIPEENGEAKTGEGPAENSLESVTVSQFIEKKPIAKLTEEERAIIIANAKSGVDQPHYDVHVFKNGNCKIFKKKEAQPTVSQKVIAKKESPVYYTDNQLLFEHIIELNAKVEKLMYKQKKLKRKYQNLQNDIYVDDSEVSPIENNEGVQEEPKQEVPQPRAPQRSVRSVKHGWRSQVAFL